MAAGAWIVLNKAKEKLMDGTIDLDTHVFKVALCEAAQALAANFATGNAGYADLTAETANGNGYTTGGATLASVTWVESAGTVTFDCADPQWTGLTKTGLKYAVIYDNTATNKDILCFCELESGGTINVTAGTLDIAINAAGVFTLA